MKRQLGDTGSVAGQNRSNGNMQTRRGGGGGDTRTPIAIVENNFEGGLNKTFLKRRLLRVVQSQMEVLILVLACSGGLYLLL